MFEANNKIEVKEAKNPLGALFAQAERFLEEDFAKLEARGLPRPQAGKLTAVEVRRSVERAIKQQDPTAGAGVEALASAFLQHLQDKEQREDIKARGAQPAPEEAYAAEEIQGTPLRRSETRVVTPLSALSPNQRAVLDRLPPGATELSTALDNFEKLNGARRKAKQGDKSVEPRVDELKSWLGSFVSNLKQQREFLLEEKTQLEKKRETEARKKGRINYGVQKAPASEEIRTHTISSEEGITNPQKLVAFYADVMLLEEEVDQMRNELEMAA